MSDKHTGEYHRLLVKIFRFVRAFFEKEGDCFAQRKSVYFNRAFGCYLNYRVTGGDIAARSTVSQKTSKGGYVQGQSKTMGPCLEDVHGTEQFQIPISLNLRSQRVRKFRNRLEGCIRGFLL